MKKLDIISLNEKLKHKSPNEIINWAINLTNNCIITTSFGVYSEVLLSAFYNNNIHIPVIWCDTLYNTKNTYIHASKIIKKYNLNINIYKPKLSKEIIDLTFGLPEVTNPMHNAFSNTVKIEPFQRALKEHQPKIWFTNIRIRQTEYRNTLDILSYSKEGILKVSPFYYWTDEDLDNYIQKNNLSKNKSYYDITKVQKNRECGIHFQ